MKRKVLAMLVPALLVAGAANAAEIYNKNGNKVELYGKMVGERILTDRENGEKGDNSQDTSYARVGVKGETQINPELTGYGQFELDLEASNRHNPDQTRLAYAGLSYKDFGSFDYGRNVGVAYDAEAFTDMFVEWGGDSWAGTDLFMTNRTNGVATYRNTDFFGMVEGLNFALQYQGKNEGTGNYKANGDTMVYLQLTLLTVSHLLVLMQTLTVLIGSLVMVKAKEPKFGRCQQNMTLTMSMLL